MDAHLAPGMCKCCETAAPPTPLLVENRPGLTAIAYRVGTFASFREAMLRAISKQAALDRLTTRESDDSAITVLELWAAVGDVLTFYQERIANESFLRTAVHRDSVLRMVRMLDYHLRPGLAATTRLAFTVEKDHAVRIPVGLKVMSTPGQDEVPQIFETVEPAAADWRWNRLPVLPKPTLVNPLAQGRQAAFLTTDAAGWQAAKRLLPKDKVVLFGGTGGGGGGGGPFGLSDVMGSGLPLRVAAPQQLWGPPLDLKQDFGFWFNQLPFFNFFLGLAEDPDAPEEKEIQEVRVEGDRFLLVWTTAIAKDAWTKDTEARLYRRKMKLFGYDAPDQFLSVKASGDTSTWSRISVHPDAIDSKTLPLERTYEDLVAGDQLLVYEHEKTPQVVTVTAVSEGEEVIGAYQAGSHSDHRHRGTVTRVTLDQTVAIDDRRNVTVYLLSGPRIPLWNADFAPTIDDGLLYVPAVKLDDDGSALEVGRTIEGKELKSGFAMRLTDLEEGRAVLLEDHTRVPAAGTLKATSVEAIAGQDFLVLEIATLAAVQLESRSAVLLGNVAAATHGETQPAEPLGDGDAAAAFQRFALRKKPLTYLPSAQSAKGDSALTVMVDGERWDETESLFGQPPTARAYTARQADVGTTVLQFGDGVTGSRLPTGRGNVLATYRQGVGLAGRVKARQLDILLQRPPGLKSVVNPAAAEGGADPETLDRARDVAPTTVKTFGRAVSLLDFESLALESGQVAKATATWVWVGLEKAVHLTVAGQEGGLFSPEALATLHSGLTRQRDPNHTLLLANVVRVPIVIEAKVVVGERFVRDTVQKAARQALLDAFAFAAVSFARPVHLSDVYRILQEVRGVEYVDIDLLHFKGWKDWTPQQRTLRGATGSKVQEHLRLFAARPLPDGVLPAEQAFFQIPAEDARIDALGGLA